MHVIIYLNGTGDNGDSFGKGTNYVFDPNVQTIKVAGCHDKEVCNAHVFPNLAKFAKRFTTKLFTMKGQQLTFTTDNLTPLHIGAGGCYVNKDTAITEITLCGYSRGAVTCFNVAKELNKMAPHIPVNIVANQPVPGNHYQLPGSNAANVADCSYINNIRNVTIILGTYTGYNVTSGKVDAIHRGFFSQIIPKLPKRSDVKRKLILIPKHHHNVWLNGVPTGIDHLHLSIAKILAKQKYVSQETITSLENKAKASYADRFEYEFPVENSLQSFFGLKRSEAYHHLDKLHPTPLVRSAMQFKPQETLIEWWLRHDITASRISSALTKALVTRIKATRVDDAAALLSLYQLADTWLLLKEGSHSSRFYQVSAFRNNLHRYLIEHNNATPQQLAKLNYDNMHKHQYFLNRWSHLSKDASRFKTDVTRKLDLAFKNHAGYTPSKQTDEKLLRELDSWLAKKDGSKSKRYEVVVGIREQLGELIERIYPVQRLRTRFAR